MDLDEHDDSVIEILDSPDLSTGTKRKRNDSDNVYSDDTPRSASKHPLLDSISSRFQQNKAERDERAALLHSKREIEKVHSDYLKQNVVDPQQLARASYAASHWAKKNGIKDSTLKAVQRNNRGTMNSPGKKRKQGTRQTNNKVQVPKNKPVRTSTVTSASLTTVRPGTSGNQDNSATPGGSRSAHNLRYPEDEASYAKYICPVMYCEAEFSSERSLGQHMNLFKHSPCNPCRFARDSKLLPDPLCYKCPKCDLEFSTKQLCSNHMNEENHLTFYPPLAVSAYLCPQCLYLFTTLESCWNHMEESRHHRISFPFKDDDVESDFSLPVAAAEAFVQDYIKKCNMAPFQVQCLDCGMDILNPARFREHQDETNNFHVMSALTNSSLADIFSTYIETFSCDNCHRLFSQQPGTDTRHICAGGIVGHIKPDQIPTMSEFVKFCALTQIPSLKGRVLSSQNLKVGKVSRTRKHDPSKILQVQLEDRRADALDELDTELDKTKALGQKFDTCKSQINGKTPYFDLGISAKVKLENSDIVTSQQVESVNSLNPVGTVTIDACGNDTFPTLHLDKIQQLNQVRPIKVESVVDDSVLVPVKQENLSDGYSEIESSERSVSTDCPYLHESEYTVKIEMQEEDEHNQTGFKNESSQKIHLDKIQQLDQVRPVKVESVVNDSVLVPIKQENLSDGYSEIESRERSVSTDCPYLHESEYTVKIEMHQEDEHNQTGFKKESSQKIDKSDPSEVQSHEYLMVVPSTSSTGRDDIIDVNSEDSENDDVGNFDGYESDDIFCISDSDEDQDVSTEHGSKDVAQIINESSEDKATSFESGEKGEVDDGIDMEYILKRLSKGARKKLRKRLKNTTSKGRKRLLDKKMKFIKANETTVNKSKSISNFDKKSASRYELNKSEGEVTPKRPVFERAAKTAYREYIERKKARGKAIALSMQGKGILAKSRMENEELKPGTSRQTNGIEATVTLKNQEGKGKALSKQEKGILAKSRMENKELKPGTSRLTNGIEAPVTLKNQEEKGKALSKQEKGILAKSRMKNKELKPGTSRQTNGIEAAVALKNQEEHLISTEYLKKMKNLVFLDYDNFPQFFSVLPHCPSEHTFVWAFYGGNTVISKRFLTETYQEMRENGLVYISERCGKTKDAADFALVLTVGKMDERLPSSVTFTIISADKGFCEVVRQMKQSTRSALLINPREDKDILLPMLKSIVET